METMEKDITIPAIHDDDLKVILVQYGLYDKVMAGMIRCYISGDIVPTPY